MTRDYVRDGTATLFAALNLLEGKVIGRCMRAPTFLLLAECRRGLLRQAHQASRLGRQLSKNWSRPLKSVQKV